MRREVLVAVKSILEDSNLFKVVRETPTKIEKERSLDIAWINLNNETFTEDSVNCVKSFRHLNLEVMVGTKQDIEEDKLNSLIDSTFALMESNYTLSGTVINCTPERVVSDEGLLFPYAMASLQFKCLVR